MLQKFGLIKYNKKFLLENNLNINPIYSPRTIKAKNYFNLKPNTTSNNLNNKLYNKNSNSSRNYKYLKSRIRTNLKYSPKIFKIFIIILKKNSIQKI